MHVCKSILVFVGLASVSMAWLQNPIALQCLGSACFGKTTGSQAVCLHGWPHGDRYRKMDFHTHISSPRGLERAFPTFLRTIFRSRGKQHVVSMSANDGKSEGRTMLFVGNLPWALDSWGLEKLFEPFGQVLKS